jgi:hypothetical protein
MIQITKQRTDAVYSQTADDRNKQRLWGCDTNRRKDDPAIWKGDGETDRTVYFEPAPKLFQGI